MKLNFLTQSRFKIETAKLALSPFGIEVVPLDLDIPEIQAATNLEIARDSAIRAAQILGEPVMREDHGFVLNAFPGWPGPFMAYTERLLPASDVLRLLEGQGRSGYFDLALVYATPAGELMEFTSRVPATVATELRPGNQDYGWDAIICLGQETRACSEFSPSDRYQYFTDNYRKLGEKLAAQKPRPQ